MNLERQPTPDRAEERQQQQQNSETQTSSNNNNNNNQRNRPQQQQFDRNAVGVVTDRTVRVYIKNIPFPLIERFDDQALVAELTEASQGSLSRYTMFTDKSGRFTGQAMATFASAESADQTIQALNGKQYSENDAPLQLELAKEHGVIMTAKLREIERDNRLAEQPWRRGDRFGRMYNEDGSLKNNDYNNYILGGGRGGSGGSGFGRGGRGGGSVFGNNNRGGAGRGGMRLPADQAALDSALANWNNES